MSTANLCEGGTCVNREGGFDCKCPPGWELSPTDVKCLDRRQDYCFDTAYRGESYGRGAYCCGIPI